jgi:hypothetical protein
MSGRTQLSSGATVWPFLDHSGTSRVNTGQILPTGIRQPEPAPSGPKSDNVDMTVPSNYSAAPSGDLCTTLKRFFDAVRWENRKSVRTRADRPVIGASLRGKAVRGKSVRGRSVRSSSLGFVGLPCPVELASAKIEILSATRDEMKRGGPQDAASRCGTTFSRTVLSGVIAQSRWFHQKSNTALARSNVPRRNAGPNIAVSSAIGSSVTRRRHPSGLPRNSFFT